MNIPHLEPIKFAQKILSVNEQSASVECSFPHAPTLGMLCEAAAQSSAAFSQESSQIGYVVSFKNIELMHQTNDLNVIVFLDKSTELSNICEFKFKILDMKESDTFIKGFVTIMIEK